MELDGLSKKKPEFFLRAMEEARSFTEALYQENLRLKETLAEAQARAEELTASLESARTDSPHQDLLSERQSLLVRLEGFEERERRVRAENEEFNARYVQVEELNNRLANLYIASLRLHSSLNQADVLATTVEIVVNLVGAHDFIMYLADHQAGTLRMIAGEGEGIAGHASVGLDEGRIGQAAQSGRVYINEDGAGDVSDPLACIPLVLDGQLIGMIVILSLLVQKEGRFSRADLEMFELLAAHAAAAISSASLYAQAEERLKTVEGYISVLRSSLHPSE